MLGPVLKGLCGRKLKQVPLTVAARDKCPKDGPEVLNVLSIFAHIRSPSRIDRHPQSLH